MMKVAKSALGLGSGLQRQGRPVLPPGPVPRAARGGEDRRTLFLLVAGSRRFLAPGIAADGVGHLLRSSLDLISCEQEIRTRVSVRIELRLVKHRRNHCSARNRLAIFERVD